MSWRRRESERVREEWILFPASEILVPLLPSLHVILFTFASVNSVPRFTHRALRFLIRVSGTRSLFLSYRIPLFDDRNILFFPLLFSTGEQVERKRWTHIVGRNQHNMRLMSGELIMHDKFSIPSIPLRIIQFLSSRHK